MELNTAFFDLLCLIPFVVFAMKKGNPSLIR